ncbi:MAG: fimbrillin family protein [Prevotellaceae bacterium]|nr:fimbrillin family protein [Candidatus Minthosoma caballi]
MLENPSSGSKTPIELSIGGIDAQNNTRAVITDGTEKDMLPFDVNTTIFMVMKSEYDTGHPDYNVTGDERKAKYTVSRGDVTKGQTTTINSKIVNTVDFDNLNVKYWDDAHARSSMISIWGFAQQGIPQRTGWLSGTFDIPNPEWDHTDPLKEYIPQTYSTADTRYPWYFDTGSKGAIYPCIMTWKASHVGNYQNATSVQYQDLLFTNNIANYSGNEKVPVEKRTDNRLKFDFDTRKFPSGEASMLKFYHAMSKITIHIKEGDGFDKTSANKDDDFKFTTGNVKLSNFNTEGTFNIKDGEFQKISEHYDIPYIYNMTTPAAGDAYTLEALVIPNINEFLSTYNKNDEYSRFVSGENKIMMEFEIDHSLYKITSNDLFKALHVDKDPTKDVVPNATKKNDDGTYIPLEAGKNYIFTFIVGKQKVNNISAQVAKWEEVTAGDLKPTNARINLKLEERGDNITESANIYRATDNPSSITDTHESYKWETGYVGNGNTYKEVSGNWELENEWFWQDNKTYYHFRALMPATTDISKDETTTPNLDYATLTSAVTFTDIRWGAPMRDVADNEDPDGFKWKYDPSTGFDVKNSDVDATKSQIYQAIGPTESKLKLILFHMMSKVKFTLITNEGETDAVIFGDGTGTNKTKVELVNYCENGKVLLGNGAVIPSGTKTSTTITEGLTKSTNYCTFGVVPQNLSGVKLRITTPDNNQYIVNLEDIVVTSVPTTSNIANPYKKNSNNEYEINHWYPGFEYKYTLKLTKKGITDINATIVDWETIEASYDNIQIQ